MDENGSIDLWNIDGALAGAGRQIAPVRLTDYNVKHIINRHSKEFAKDEKSVLDFLEDVLGYITQLRKTRGTAMFVVAGNRKVNKAAIIRLTISDSGDYYNIETGGYYRDNYRKEDEKIIWGRSEPVSSDTVADSSIPQTADVDGGRMVDAEDQMSFGKDKDSSETSKSDEDYPTAVESGDMETAQRLLMDAA